MKTRIVKLGTGAFRVQKERDFGDGARWVFATSIAHTSLTAATKEQTDWMRTAQEREFAVVPDSERETPAPKWEP